jgi:protein SCO1/2
MKSSRNRAAAALVAVAMAVAISTAYAAADTRRGADYFTNVELTTHEGRTVRFYDDLIKGKIVAIDLIYTTCQYACPLETARLAQVQRLLGERMGRDVFFYSITIDPDHDTPPVLAEYARKYQAGPGWLFLTGAKADIDRLSRKLGLSSPPDPTNPDGHQPYLLVGNESTGQWMRNSATDNARFLARTIGEWVNQWQGPERNRLKSYAEAPVLADNPGQYAFAYHCAACHTIGGGIKIGPDLAGVTSRRDRDWLQQFIRAPDAMNAAGDPVAVALRKEYQQARMPNLDLSEVDSVAVIDYIEAQSRQHAVAAPPQAASVEASAMKTASRGTAADPVQSMVDAYFRVQQALVADRVDTIAVDGRAIAAQAGRFGDAGDALRAAAASLEQAADVRSARMAFGDLSDRVIAIVRASNPRVDPNLSVIYCPMAQKYWLQQGRAVQNPYYGKAMLECGRIVPP